MHKGKLPIIIICLATFFIILSFAYVKEMEKERLSQEGILSKAETEREGIGKDKERGKIQYVAGDIIIKIKPEAIKNFAKVLKSKNLIDSIYKDDVIYNLAKYDIKKISHVFPNYTFKAAPKEKEEISKMKKSLSRVFLLKIPSDTDIMSVVKDIKRLPYIKYAEPNYMCYPDDFPLDLPNDTYVDPDGDNNWSTGAWGQSYEDMWGLKAIDIKPEGEDTVWATSQGEGIVVAVIDTGIDYTHEDLEENIWINKGELPPDLDTDRDDVISFDEIIINLQDYNSDGLINLKDSIHSGSPYRDNIDDDNNGYVDDILGWDFGYGDNDPFDNGYHGSHVAGTIAGRGNNNKGIIGVAPKAKLMAIAGLVGPISALSNCIVYAADNGARVLSNSWHSGSISQLLEDAIKNAYYQDGCIVVASAGNKNRNALLQSPACINEVITVANLSPVYKKSRGSNWGSIIDVIAPGSDILSINADGRSNDWRIVGNENKYLKLSGTSMACPHVSGLAALVLSKNPSFTNEQVNQVIRKSAADITDPLADGADYIGWDIYTGYGLINAKNALQIESSLECRITEPRTETSISSTGDIEIKGIVAGTDFQSYSVRYKEEGEDLWHEIINDDPTPHPLRTDTEGNPAFDTLGSFTPDIVEGNCIISLTVKDIYNSIFEDRIILQIDLLNISTDKLIYGNNETIYINGTAIGPLFNSYTIEWGRGENPSEWSSEGIILENTGTQEVINGRLGTADSNIFSEKGRYTLRLLVLDNNNNISENTTFFYFNNPPIIQPIETKVVNEGEVLEFTVQAYDPDGDPISSYEIIDQQGERYAYINNDGVFRWQPYYDQAGEYNFSVIVSDGQLQSGEAINIVVINAHTPDNQAPYIGEILPQIVYEGEVLEFGISAWDSSYDILEFYLENQPSGAWIREIDERTSLFTWRPDYDQEGEYNFSVIVSDGQLQSRREIRITVFHVNRPPVLEPLERRIVAVGERLMVTVFAYDPDDEDLLTFYMTWLGLTGEYPLPSGATFNPAIPAFYWTPDRLQVASGYRFVLHVSDGYDEVTQILYVDVLAPPVIRDISPKTVNEGEVLTFTVEAYDPAGYPLTFSLHNEPYGAAIDPDTGTFNWQPGFDQSGAYNITVIVSDGRLEAREDITINVINVNRPPVIAEIPILASGVWMAGFPLYFNVPADDPDGDPLTFRLINAPDGAGINANGYFSWLPEYSQGGVHNFTIVVSDGEFEVSKDITIRINRPPVIELIPVQTVDVGETLILTINAYDPDGDELRFQMYWWTGHLEYPLPDGATFDASTHIFSWQPNQGQARNYPYSFLVTVLDGYSYDRKFVVVNVNGVPEIAQIQSQTVNEGGIVSFNISATDPNNDLLTFSLHNEPYGAAIDPNTGTFNWQPGFDQSGAYNITVIVSDGRLEAREDININVINVNRPPNVIDISPLTVNEGDALRYTVHAGDPDNQILTFSLQNAPNGMVINTNTGELSWIPDFTQAGSYTFNVVVSDSEIEIVKIATISVIDTGPNLVIKKAKKFARRIWRGGRVRLGGGAIVTIANKGNMDLTHKQDFYIAYNYDRRRRKYISSMYVDHGGIIKDGSIKVEILMDWRDFPLRFMVDYHNSIDELDETDNEYESTELF